MADASQRDPRPALSFWDVVSLLCGIVVGTAIFKAPAAVFRSVHAPWEAIALWLAGGLLSLAGALCYAELSAAYPRSGGDYEYLSRAYGRWMGLQFVFAQLLAVLTGSLGSMAYAFADYAVSFWRLPAESGVWLALTAIGVLTLTNAAGLVAGKTAQNLLTAGKFAGLAAVAILGFAAGDHPSTGLGAPAGPREIGLALVFIFYAYSGWSHAAYVASEIRDPQRTLPRALLTGVVVVTALYVIVNLAYVRALSFDGVRLAEAPAAAAVETVAGPHWGRAVAVLVMLSALGAINGTILTGAHVFAVLGDDYHRLSWLRRSSDAQRRPLRPLFIQAAVTLIMVLSVGTDAGRSFVDRLLGLVSLPPVPWASYYGGFETLVAAAAPLFWLFFLLTGLSLPILRWRDPDRPRPFRVPGYPLTPLLFSASAGYMLYASVTYAKSLTLLAIGPMLIAGLVAWGHRQQVRRIETTSDSQARQPSHGDRRT